MLTRDLLVVANLLVIFNDDRARLFVCAHDNLKKFWTVLDEIFSNIRG